MRRRGARVALALCLVAAAARAQGERVDKAKEYFNAGAEAYGARQYLAAIQAFEAAQKLAPRPAILFSLGQAERRQYLIDRRPERLRAAIAHYRAYLEQEPQGARRGDAVEALAELEPMAGRLGAQGPAPREEKRPTRLLVSSSAQGALVSLDGGEATPAPLVREVRPGKHAVLVRAPGYFDERDELMAVESDLVALHVALRPRPGLLAFRVPEGARLFLDGRELGGAPLGAPVEVEPGAHVVAVTRPGRRAVAREVVVGRGERQTFAADLPVTGQRVASFALLGAGGAALLAGGGGAALALAREGEAKDLAAAGESRSLSASERDRYNGALEARDLWVRVAGVSLGAGAALLAAGALLYAFDHPSPVGPLAPRAAPRRDDAPRPGAADLSAGAFVLPGAAGAALGGRF
ncbi:MAG TPA: PEGA domain-containing protein [Polyangiaceae bacterium]|nr:PEGA domain-containing protein [Polyangiaceae bacterium]